MNIIVLVSGLLLVLFVAVESCEKPSESGRSDPNIHSESGKKFPLRRRRTGEFVHPLRVHIVRPGSRGNEGNQGHHLRHREGKPAKKGFRPFHIGGLSEAKTKEFLQKLMEMNQATEGPEVPADFQDRMKHMQIPSKQFCDEMSSGTQKQLHLPWWKESCQKFYDKEMREMDLHKLRYLPVYKPVLDKLQAYKKKQRMEKH